MIIDVTDIDCKLQIGSKLGYRKLAVVIGHV